MERGETDSCSPSISVANAKCKPKILSLHMTADCMTNFFSFKNMTADCMTNITRFKTKL